MMTSHNSAQVDDSFRNRELQCPGALIRNNMVYIHALGIECFSRYLTFVKFLKENYTYEN